MLNQNFYDAFVASTSKLLPTGTTVNLAPGQIGIFDSETYKALITPDFRRNRGLVIAQGSPDYSDMPKGAGIRNETFKAAGGKSIMAHKVIDWKGKAASRGQKAKIAIGYDGVDRTKTLSGKCGDILHFYVTVTGRPITNLIPQGVTKHYQVEVPACDPCVDDCTSVADPNFIADELVRLVKEDQLIAGIDLSKYITASKISDCTTAAGSLPLVVFDIFTLTVNDGGTISDFTAVQSQYPTYKITVLKRDGNFTTYQVIVPDGVTPAAYTNAGTVIIPNCPVAPNGYTLVQDKFAYEVIRQDAGDAGAQTTVATEFGIVAPETIVRIAYRFGESTYLITSTTAQTESASVILVNDGRRPYAVITSATTVAWVAAGSANKAKKTFKITLADNECGVSRLAEIQAVYSPNPRYSNIVQGTDGECATSYTIDVLSDNSEVVGCFDPQFVFTAPEAFEGVEFEEVSSTLAAGEGCVAGVIFESAYVSRKLAREYYNIFPYEVEDVVIEVSQWNPDWHGSPFETYAPVTELQAAKYPSGNGEYVLRMEEKAAMYRGQLYSTDMARRLAEGTELYAKESKFYDEYKLVFQVSYQVLGWSDWYTDTYELHLFFEEGTGKAFETAINSFLESAKSNIPPVIL